MSARPLDHQPDIPCVRRQGPAPARLVKALRDNREEQPGHPRENGLDQAHDPIDPDRVAKLLDL
ncbi:hypothetical protein [Desulfohalovibrio reitneri]|uniref:hypothetical protein n=1 Tax=Desulfohalovibrio reitneri TaxID=1307759 RepID=UPI0004A7125C|nr:hypothetical protein [Desulfohalovibrio reitneri]